MGRLQNASFATTLAPERFPRSLRLHEIGSALPPSLVNLESMLRFSHSPIALRFALFGLVSSLLAGCGEPPPPGGEQGTGGTNGSGGMQPMEIPQVECPLRTNVYVAPENNYSFTGLMDIQHTVLKDASDLTFDWSQVSVDFFGKQVNAQTDIDLFLVSLWKLTPEELEANLSIDRLPLESVIAPVSKYTEKTITSANLLSFDVLGEPLDEEELWRYFDTSNPGFATPQDSHSFLVTAQTGTELGKDARMLHIFTIDPTSTQTSLSLTNTSTTLTYDVELEAALPFQVPLGQPGLTIDWSFMDYDAYGGLNSLGNPFLVDQINEVVVAHFASSTLPELEQNFLKLEDMATAWYSGPVTRGVSLDMSTLTTAEGTPFSGIDGTGIWMAALFCTANCNNPAPWSITVLQPCAQ